MKKAWCWLSLICLLGSVAFGFLYYRGIRLGNEAATEPSLTSTALFDSAYAMAWTALACFVGFLVFFYVCKMTVKRRK